MRFLCSAVLSFEALAVVLGIAPAIAVAGVAPGQAVAGGLLLAAACLVTVGLLRRRWGYLVGTLVQVAVVATGLVLPAMFVLGGIFAVLWGTAIVLGGRVDA